MQRNIGWSVAAVVAFSLLTALALAEEAQDQQEADRERLQTLAAEVVRDVERLRGWEFERPVEVAVQTREQLTRKLSEEMDARIPPELMRRREAFLKLTGLVPRDVDIRETWLEMLSAGVGGYYDTDEQTFYIMLDTARRYGPLPLGALIAHELTHALDDQHIGLDALMESALGDSDREFAVAAVIEGSATVLMTRYMVMKMDESGLGLLGLTLGSLVMMTQDAEAIEAMRRSPRYFQTFLAAYTLGQSFYFWTNIEDGRYVERSIGDAVRQAADDPPRSSQQIIHPAKYWDPDRRVDPLQVVDDDVRELIADLGAGLQVVHAETAGELLMAIVTEPEDDFSFAGGAGAAAWTNEVARRWSGDRFFVLESDEADNAGEDAWSGLWITVWDSEEARDAFGEAYEQHRPAADRRIMRFGDLGMVHTFGLDDATAGLLEQRLRETPPRHTRAGEPVTLEGVEAAP